MQHACSGCRIQRTFALPDWTGAAPGFVFCLNSTFHNCASYRQAAFQHFFIGTMSDCLNKKTITYSKRAVQRPADSHLETSTTVSSPSLGGFLRFASEETSKSKAGTMHAFLQRLPPSVGVKRKIVRNLFHHPDLFHMCHVLMNASARYWYL